MDTTMDGIRRPKSRIDSCGSEKAQKLIHANSTHEYPRPHVFFKLRISVKSNYDSERNQRSIIPVRTISNACEATANHRDILQLTLTINTD